MNCATVQSDNLVERYVLGQMSAEEQGSFEEHFFVCDPCFDAVRLMQTLQAVAAERPRARPAVRMPGRKWAAWGAAAAVLIAGFVLAERWRPRGELGGQTATTQSAPAVDAAAQLRLLAQVEAPRYTPSTLRSASGNRDELFRAAMAQYTRGNYTAAADELRALTDGGAETAAARFYLGISCLMTGSVSEAAVQLRGTESLGETPYLEEARFFLAKALLAKQDVAGAMQALQRTVALAGDRDGEARKLLDELRALPAVR